ncbi:ComEC/Rec2 family competence protein [Helicobacter canis]|uniref:DNA transfer protein ComE n=1 Tax=Helicobacter canis TaxID=29419 RepID=A0A377J489_9HELI|nr:ComEC/Rec2 family competence protein [Helicobacter canis]STO97139.1 DNA transfer protein ComE [Helicobacter canis]
MAQKTKGSPYVIALFSPRQWVVAYLVLFVLLLGRVGLEYYQYLQLPFAAPKELEAIVQAQYTKTKNNATYFVLKLRYNAHTLYTTSKEDLKPLQGRSVRIYGKMGRDCSFVQYLQSCFFLNFSLATLPNRHNTQPLVDAIYTQHTNPMHASLFSTLFFATPLDKSWREVSNKLGLAHIFAISGFHLGIISFVLFALLAPLYRAVQRRYCSYRNEIYDLGLLVLLALFGYLFVLDFTPSFLRAFVMACMGYVLYISGLQIVSFAMLAFVGVACVVLFPSVAFNRGFILSMAGVFYIFLFVRYVHISGSWLRLGVQILGLNCAVFLSIMPIVHYFFPYFSLYQCVSIPISIAFVVIFPLVVSLHSVGLGGVFDRILDVVLAWQIPYIEVYTPLWFLGLYVGVSALAMITRYGYYALLSLAVGFYGYCAYRLYLGMPFA